VPITIQVNGTSLTLVHKFSNGISTATVPDVCKTPTPGGPVPMPYPNIAQSITLSDGTTTVKGDKAMAANKGSKFALSNGDQPGTIGGVKSNVFMKEATWILYSPDVKLQSKNACRLTDSMFHNSENTVNMAGVIQAALVAAGLTPKEAKAVCDAFCEAQDEYNKGKLKGQSPSQAFEKKLNQLKKDGVLGEGVSAEQPFFMQKPGRPEPINLMGDEGQSKAVFDRVDFLAEHEGITLTSLPLDKFGKPSMAFLRDVASKFGDRLVSIPDLVIERRGIRSVFDAKFNYEVVHGEGRFDKWGDSQLRAYRKIDDNTKPTAITPKGCGCRGAGRTYSDKQEMKIAEIEAKVK
jgi:hypothetical protein